MSRLDDLIQELCPDGVPFQKINDVSVARRGKWIKSNNLTPGDVPVITSAKESLYTHNVANSTGKVVVVASSGAYAGFISYFDTPIYLSNVFAFDVDISKIDAKFLYYVLKSRQQEVHDMKSGGGVPNVYAKDVGRLKIPIPPLKVQKEIINILDKFMELDAELSAELDARQKQYEYYRNDLLGFDDVELPRIKLAEVAMYSKSRIASVDLDHENYIGVDNLLQNRQGKEDSSHVPGTGNMTRYESGDVLIGNIRPYLKKIWYADRVGGTNGDVLVIHIKDECKEKLKSRYLYHLLASDKFFTYNMQNSKGAKMPRGDKNSIMKFEISVPPIEEQERVVSILDKFDAVTNSISEGLPAEIAARRMQYEYYRTKLLTFKELPA